MASQLNLEVHSYTKKDLMWVKGRSNITIDRWSHPCFGNSRFVILNSFFTMIQYDNG